ncbi:hypothetical protein THITH_17210 [Thioalkalivibrio paradoxus ARh 1]|uniref:Uncharacterized protein n=1 Tax=Thioalkalivibrio paradoxus ARh 1 TaxID=713585 RepID=W0DP02_9GAMM|nr:hypothetical protein THITH_17210 [Thioalkalivibrio paradoxus ARh 1]
MPGVPPGYPLRVNRDVLRWLRLRSGPEKALRQGLIDTDP